jgi:hypothetical protein
MRTDRGSSVRRDERKRRQGSDAMFVGTVPIVGMVAALSLVSPTANAAPLDVVSVDSPAINCVFDPGCTITVKDTSSAFALPGMEGLARLQSRTFAGSPGAPGAGRRGYEYRLDLSHVWGTLNIACVTSLTLEFGPVVGNLDYDGNGDGDDVFVIAAGGLGDIAPTSAKLDGHDVTFVFGTPVCPGAYDGDGDSTFFFGLTSIRSPRTVVAEVNTPNAAGIAVGARAPQLSVALAFQPLHDNVVALPFDSLVGPPALREHRRRALLQRLSVAERAAENGHMREAIRALEEFATLMDGEPPDWVVDDPRTDTDERATLLALVGDVIDELGSPTAGCGPAAGRGRTLGAPLAAARGSASATGCVGAIE